MEIEHFPDRVGHVVEGLRERAAGAVAPDSGSVFRELANVTRRIDTAEHHLGERIDAVETSLDGRLRALARAEAGTSWPRRLFWMVIGAGIGMGVEYLADPDRGRARRTQLSDQAAARARDVSGDLQKKAKITADRARGQVLEGAKDVLPEDVPDDPKLLEQRIKSDVFGRRDDVQDVVLRVDGPGSVALKGTVPTADSQRELLAEIADVEGVIDVRSELSIRST